MWGVGNTFRGIKEQEYIFLSQLFLHLLELILDIIIQEMSSQNINISRFCLFIAKDSFNCIANHREENKFCSVMHFRFSGNEFRLYALNLARSFTFSRHCLLNQGH
jgi:hypothetical protein